MAGNADEYSGTDLNSRPVGGSGDGPIDPATLDGSTGGNGPGEFDPAIHVGPDKRNADGSYTRKRGRKSGGGSGASKAKVSPDLKSSIDALAKTLVIVHVGLAGVTENPELVIDQDEGLLLANATANVLEQFDLKPDPKTQAIIGLLMAAGTVYGPRAFMIKQRRAQQAREKQAGTAGVYDPQGFPVGTTQFSEVG